MGSTASETDGARIALHPVDRGNWRAVARLKVSEAQREFVAAPSYYLALCCYGGGWRPLAVCLDERVIGFMMWAVDPADGSCWLGGILIDQSMQRRGYGRQAVQAAMGMLTSEHGYKNFALSYQPANLVAKELYRKLGFVETNEWEDDEIVARLVLTE
jgi:diamine N-acetyltransferase